MMAQVGLRQALKKVLPAAVTKALVNAENYGQRLAACAIVARCIRGRTVADARVVRKSLARAPVHLLRNLDVYREPMLIADAEVVSKGLGIFAVRGNCDDLGHVLLPYFSAMFDCIGENVKEGDVVIDAGANLGAVTVFLAQQVGISGKVLTVEMMPATATQLRRNIVLNNLHNVTVVEKALAEKPGMTVTADVEAGMHGQASIARAADGRERHSLNVLTTTIDEIAAGLGEIALIKLDLEGAEPNALRGANATLPRVRAIVFESWHGGDSDETARILRSAGFVITPVDGRNWLARRRQPVEKAFA